MSLKIVETALLFTSLEYIHKRSCQKRIRNPTERLQQLKDSATRKEHIPERQLGVTGEKFKVNFSCTRIWSLTPKGT